MFHNVHREWAPRRVYMECYIQWKLTKFKFKHDTVFYWCRYIFVFHTKSVFTYGRMLRSFSKLGVFERRGQPIDNILKS